MLPKSRSCDPGARAGAVDARAPGAATEAERAPAASQPVSGDSGRSLGSSAGCVPAATSDLKVSG